MGLFAPICSFKCFPARHWFCGTRFSWEAIDAFIAQLAAYNLSHSFSFPFCGSRKSPFNLLFSKHFSNWPLGLLTECCRRRALIVPVLTGKEIRACRTGSFLPLSLYVGRGWLGYFIYFWLSDVFVFLCSPNHRAKPWTQDIPFSHTPLCRCPPNY